MSARSYAGGAAASTLSSGIAAGDATFSVASATTWPSSGAFSVVIDRGLAGEEKVLVASRSGNTLTITTRGYDGTSAAAHSSGATVECCATATDFQEANDHVNASTNVHGLSGGAAVVGTTTSQTLTNKTLTAPVISTISNTGTLTLPTSTDTLVGKATTDTLTNKTLTAAVLDAASTLGGVSGTSLAADRTAWTAFTPSVSGITSVGAGGSAVGAYKQVGKILFVRIDIQFGTTPTVSGNFGFTLPNSLAAASSGQQSMAGIAFQSSTGFRWRLVGGVAASATSVFFAYADGVNTLVAAGQPVTWASGDHIVVDGVIEVA